MTYEDKINLLVEIFQAVSSTVYTEVFEKRLSVGDSDLEAHFYADERAPMIARRIIYSQREEILQLFDAVFDYDFFAEEKYCWNELDEGNKN